MFLLILDSIGSTELLFILIMALIFFGPRKLPQLSRSLGKNLAEFRKASEDFKRTWEREVALEESQGATPSEPMPYQDNSIMNTVEESKMLQEPAIEAVSAAEAIARETVSGATPGSNPLPETSETANDQTQSEAPRKQDWL